MGVSCGGKGHGFGGWCRFGGIVIGLGCEGFGNVARGCDDETGGHGGLGDEGGGFVGGVHGHFEVGWGGWGDSYVEGAILGEGDFDGIYSWDY